MLKYGKTSQSAISIMSLLAEHYDEEGTIFSSGDIACCRGLAQSLVAKLMTQLSREGLISGRPGPHGGYRLAREPEEICLLDIVKIFESTDQRIMCPFGPDWCGNNDPCPLHDQLAALDERVTAFLAETTLAVFAREETVGLQSVCSGSSEMGTSVN